MTSSSDPVDLLSRALAQTGAVIDGVQDHQLGNPTPCPAWTVADLLDHLVHDLRQFTERARGGTPDWGKPAERQSDGRPEAFRVGAAGLVEAWRQAGDLGGVVELPGMGTLPARFPVDQQIAEFAVHTWDLLRATGQSPDLDEEIGRSALAWAQTALRPEFRGDEASGKAFGPEVQARPDAEPYDRLAAFFGRDPDRA